MSDQAYWDAFFQLHRGLPREGPGLPEDVAWAAGIAGVKPDANILDAACGPGADIAALLTAAPEGRVLAVEKVPHFVQEAAARAGDDPRVEVAEADMMAQEGPFDFIWCAGAVYFIGVAEALTGWRTALAPGGAIAFSQVCWTSDNPPQAARDHWADYPDMTDEAGIRALIAKAGYEICAERRLSDAAWEAYYGPLDAAAQALEAGATGAMRRVLEEQKEEAAVWRDARDHFGYTLFVVRPA